MVQENTDKDFSVQKCDNNPQTSHLKYAHVHALYIFIHTFTSTHHFPS